MCTRFLATREAVVALERRPGGSALKELRPLVAGARVPRPDGLGTRLVRMTFTETKGFP